MALRRLLTVARKSPTLTASIQASGLMCLGDVISQTVIEKNEKFDKWRTIRFGAIGFFICGPVLQAWYKFLETRIKLKSRGMTAVAKMFADQGLMAPLYLAGFTTINSALQSQPWEKIKSDISATYKDILVAHYQVWPAVQMINFIFLPLKYQVLYVQTVTLFWNTYMSWKTNNV